MPPVLARTAAKGCAILSFAVCVPLALFLGERSWVAALSLVVGMSAIVMFAGLMFGNGLHAVLRPCTDEIERVLSSEQSPDYRDWSLAARLALACGTSSAIAGIGIAGFTLGTQATPRHFALAIVFSTMLALYLILVNHIGLVQPAMSSVNDLLAAVKRVRRGDFATRVPVTTIDEFGDLAIAFNEMQSGLRERESLHAGFASYVDPALAQRLLTQENSIFEGEDVTVTVLFADVRGFSTFAEDVSASEAVRQLNRLFEVVVPIVFNAGGHVNHYIGDGVLAVFGTPNGMADHAGCAVGVAREIQQMVRKEFGDELEIGIGINTGPVIAGSIGGGGRFEFTVIGDTVNVASRVERMTRQTNDSVLVTQATLAAMAESLDCATDRGEVAVRGRVGKQRIYAIDPF
jgi:class 3 adenylate cyclase